MIPGVKIQMGGQDWQVPPLTLGQLRRLQPLIAQLTSGDTLQVMEAVCDLVSAALSRNYPDMTSDKAADLIDLGNRASVIDAVMGSSGLQLGEAAAVTGPNGAASMDSSPPRVDTAIQ